MMVITPVYLWVVPYHFNQNLIVIVAYSWLTTVQILVGHSSQHVQVNHYVWFTSVELVERVYTSLVIEKED